jgi:maltose alpha-D-glucosyltransferase/alpha-amylase
VRQSHPAFARGEIRFLAPANHKVLAYLRILDAEILLCVVNLSETAQAAELDLGEWAGRVPVEMFGGCPFPALRKEPYTITLPGHEFLWLKLFPPEEVDPARGVPLEAMDRPDLPAADKPVPPRPREKAGAVPDHPASHRK